jgi:sulfhydrogenase subunit gamma (sulfur reductase)
VTITCGPPVMIKATLLTLKKLGFTPDQMIVTLEAKMKCGMGKCGRCNLGEKYVCTDGPVFSCAELSTFLESF